VLPCPSCGRPLDTSTGGGPEHLSCPDCGGRAYALRDLPRAFPAEFVRGVLAVADEGGWRGHRRCPRCALHMVLRRVEFRGAPYTLDHCDRCRLLWMERGEHEAAAGLIPAPPPPDPVLDGPPTTRRYAPGSEAAEDVDVVEGIPDGPAGCLGVLGLPLVLDADAPARPWTTWSLAGAMVAVTALAHVLGGEAVLEQWGLVPSLPFRHGGLDVLTSTFLHANIWHLLVNVWFLLAFGPPVEGLLRPRRFLLVAALASLGGSLLRLVLAHGSLVASVGSSGAISGILAYGALALPRTRIRFTWIVWFRPFTYTCSARLAFGLWIAIQCLGALGEWMGATEVDHLAHLGGAAVGAAFWYYGPDGPRPVAPAGDTIRLKTPLRWEE